MALLVAAKADIDDNRNASLMTPLHMACQDGYRDVCLGLLICAQAETPWPPHLRKSRRATWASRA